MNAVIKKEGTEKTSHLSIGTDYSSGGLITSPLLIPITLKGGMIIAGLHMRNRKL